MGLRVGGAGTSLYPVLEPKVPSPPSLSPVRPVRSWRSAIADVFAAGKSAEATNQDQPLPLQELVDHLCTGLLAAMLWLQKTQQDVPGLNGGACRKRTPQTCAKWRISGRAILHFC